MKLNIIGNWPSKEEIQRATDEPVESIIHRFAEDQIEIVGDVDLVKIESDLNESDYLVSVQE